MKPSFGVLAALALLPLTPVRAQETGLVAHWDFDEGRGDVAKDVAGHGHDATLRNIAWTPSPRGGALRFDGKESLARYGRVDSMNLSGDMTLAVWVKTDAAIASGTNRLIFGDAGGGVDRNLNLRLDGSGGLRFEWANGKECVSLVTPGVRLNGAWRHVAVVADSQKKTVIMYVDGAEAACMTGAIPISRAPVRERLTGWFYDGFFQGELDDIRLYERALAADEVRRLFTADADLQVGTPTVQFDGSQPAPRGIASVKLHNWSREERLVELESATVATRTIAMKPGAETEVTLGEVALRPVWLDRKDLFICAQHPASGRASVAVHRGNLVERLMLGLAPQPSLEPLQVDVRDPWQAQMAPDKAPRVEATLKFAMPAEQLRQGRLQIRLVARESGREALTRQIDSPGSTQAVTIDAVALPWGAYDLIAGFHNCAGREVISVKRMATILPRGQQQIRTLNNLVAELTDARARGLLKSGRLELMNPRDGWVWFRASGDCSLRLGEDRLLAAKTGQSPVEAMRLLPAGKHVLQVAGAPTELHVRAIPALVYNVYPSAPMIKPFGANTWERLSRHMLPNVNMIESHAVDTPEYRQWLAQGKLWLAPIQAPGLIDAKEWTAEAMLNVWRNPGASTAWAERSGLELAKLSGVQVDEYYPGAKSTGRGLTLTTALSIAQLAEDSAFRGKLWIPFFSGRYGATDALLMKTLLGSGWPFSEEVYVGETPTEAENQENIRRTFLRVAADYEGACPGALRRMIFTPMYAYLPYCTSNRCPQADFRVHLDMQMHMLAADAAFFGLWGVQPYRSNYVDEEILNCMGKLLRHYCIEGRTERMLADPYELRHVVDPDFAAGTRHWQVAAAEPDAVSAGKFTGYGTLQGRYPASGFGDTFLLVKRSAQAPNDVSQRLQGLQPGRLYSVKVISGDYADLTGGKTRRDQQTLSIKLDGAEVLPGGFSHPFPCGRGPKPFTKSGSYWMTYHWLRFRALAPNARLTISDWKDDKTPGGPIGQRLMCSFVEVQPVLPD